MSQEGRYRIEMLQWFAGQTRTVSVLAAADQHRVLDLAESLSRTARAGERYQVIDTHERVILWDSVDAEIDRLSPLDARD